MRISRLKADEMRVRFHREADVELAKWKSSLENDRRAVGSNASTQEDIETAWNGWRKAIDKAAQEASGTELEDCLAHTVTPSFQTAISR